MERGATHGLVPRVALGLILAVWAGLTGASLLQPRSLSIRAHHATHVTERGQECTSCHLEAPQSTRSQDLLLPRSEACEPCHPSATCEGPVTDECLACHEGQPRSHLAGAFAHKKETVIRFGHIKHVARVDAGCQSCHPLDPVKPDQRNPLLPSMTRCLECHPHGQAFASDTCSPCHERTKKGTLLLDPAGKPLVPPAWMQGAEHDGAWVLTHATSAATRPGLCAACHVETHCAGCHAGKVKPAAIHPGDWLSFHPVTATVGDLRCSACHSYQAFCLTCHRRTGVAWDSPTGQGVPAGDVFHPSGWYSLGGASGHATQARKNLSTCVSCHTENDCITCHSSSSTFSVSPHPPSGLWLSKCKGLARKNPLSCLKCHPSVPLSCR